ncbi:MAG: hypothetical protein ACRELD_10285 [Longimicrobiales bacterium]
MAHEMFALPLGGGWEVMGMAQAYPIVTIGAPGEDDSPLRETAFYLTQPALMANVESPGSHVVLRTTLNVEGVTQPDGELTFGGWGEGFIDKRHPHTLLHELMLSFNAWDVLGGVGSLSAGKGFAPYGTDDPMARPALKYPTNHHLSQLLERWTVNAVFLRAGWSVEAGIFGGAEPEGPYDLSNIESFGDSWSVRAAKRWGAGWGPDAAWEASVSAASVREEHDGVAERTSLWNAALRHEGHHEAGRLYTLLEGSLSDPEAEEEQGDFSILGEALLESGRHMPYARLEYATRPEYAREGAPGTSGFFRYDHDAEPLGATRWLITSLGYGYRVTGYPVSVRPFIDVQHQKAWAERGGIEPDALFGTESFWMVSIGARVFLGGQPMRMGAYGVLDPMTSMRRGMAEQMAQPVSAHEVH